MMVKIVKRIINFINKQLLFADLGYRPCNITVMGRIYTLNKNVRIGLNVQLYPNVTFMGDGDIVIGNNVKIGNNVCICSSRSGGVFIGDDTLIAANCYIIDANHQFSKGMNISNQPNNIEKLEIGKDVWLGNSVSVIKGAHIEDGVVVGAKSLVNSHLVSNSICWGIPAKKMKERTI